MADRESVSRGRSPTPTPGTALASGSTRNTHWGGGGGSLSVPTLAVGVLSNRSTNPAAASAAGGVSAQEGNAIQMFGNYSTNLSNLPLVGGSQQTETTEATGKIARQSSAVQLDPETAAQLDPLHDLMAMVADDHRADDVTIDLTTDAVDGVLDAVREDVAFGRVTTTVDREVAGALLFAGLTRDVVARVLLQDVRTDDEGRSLLESFPRREDMESEAIRAASTAVCQTLINSPQLPSLHAGAAGPSTPAQAPRAASCARHPALNPHDSGGVACYGYDAVDSAGLRACAAQTGGSPVASTPRPTRSSSPEQCSRSL